MKKFISLVIVAIWAIVSIAAPIKSVMGARNTIITDTESKEYTAADYVQDGLIAMWDGEWNAGWGVHDNNATTWVDLTGHGYDLYAISPNVSPVAEWGETFAQFRRKNQQYFRTDRFPNLKNEVKSVSCIAAWEDSGYLACAICFGDPETSSGWSWQIFRQNNSSTSGSIQGSNTRNFTLSIGEPISVHGNFDEKVYINNIQTTTCPHFRLANVPYCYVGHGLGGFTMYGKIYRIALYSRTLTSSEMSHNYRIDKVRFNLP